MWIEIKTCLHCTCIFLSCLKTESEGWSSFSYLQIPRACADLMPLLKLFTLTPPERKRRGDVYHQVQRLYKMVVQSIQ